MAEVERGVFISPTIRPIATSCAIFLPQDVVGDVSLDDKGVHTTQGVGRGGSAAMSIPEKNSNRPEPMAYGRGILRGLGINILVHNVDRSARFQSEIFGARILYWEEHFAIMQAVDSTWLLHSDWSYRSHELIGAVAGVQARGCGVELRLYGVDPDQAEAAARRRDAVVLAGAADKEHGLREAYIVDDDGYVWVPSVPVPSLAQRAPLRSGQAGIDTP